jgi:hypothetical protein
MTRKLDIEDALDRSLASQVKAPRLGRRFDAAVWTRIEAVEQGATNPVSNRTGAKSSARWLFIINVIGTAVAVLLVVIFGMQPFAGVSVSLPTPQVSAAVSEDFMRMASLAITIVSVVFGLLFTPLGRWLRAQLS